MPKRSLYSNPFPFTSLRGSAGEDFEEMRETITNIARPTHHPITSAGSVGVSHIKRSQAKVPLNMEASPPGVLALGHQIPAVKGIKSPTKRMENESSNRLYTSPT